MVYGRRDLLRRYFVVKEGMLKKIGINIKWCLWSCSLAGETVSSQ